MKRVAIIGGGPSGLGVARALASEGVFEITIYERQTQFGGIWVYTGTGPIYRDLDSNIYKQLMEYCGRPFPDDVPQFVPRQDVLAYLEAYGREVAALPGVRVEFGATVSEAVKEGARWKLELNGKSVSADFVVVASGHFDAPNYPAIEGLREFRARHPDRVLHSRHYVVPEPFANKKTLVVGNAASGVDMTIQLLGVTAPVHVSRRHESITDGTFDGGNDVIWKPEAVSVSPDGEFLFQDGTRETYDAVVLGTGYLYTVPFLEAYNCAQKYPVLDAPAYQRVQNLYKYMFHIGDPTLTVVVVNQQIVPFPLAELQGAVIARVWSGKLSLPPVDEMLADEKRLVDERGTGRGYLLLGPPVDIQYFYELYDWAASADDEKGFLGERWSPEKAEMRRNVGTSKLGEYKRKLEEARKKRESGRART